MKSITHVFLIKFVLKNTQSLTFACKKNAKLPKKFKLIATKSVKARAIYMDLFKIISSARIISAAAILSIELAEMPIRIWIKNKPRIRILGKLFLKI